MNFRNQVKIKKNEVEIQIEYRSEYNSKLCFK